jgi:hypothetical protein
MIRLKYFSISRNFAPLKGGYISHPGALAGWVIRLGISLFPELAFALSDLHLF